MYTYIYIYICIYIYQIYIYICIYIYTKIAYTVWKLHIPCVTPIVRISIVGATYILMFALLGITARIMLRKTPLDFPIPALPGCCYLPGSAGKSLQGSIQHQGPCRHKMQKQCTNDRKSYAIIMVRHFSKHKMTNYIVQGIDSLELFQSPNLDLFVQVLTSYKRSYKDKLIQIWDIQLCRLF